MGVLDIFKGRISKMDERGFWKVIDLFDWDEEGDDDSVVAPAREALKRLGAEAIFSFDDILAEKLYTLDTRAHCKACYQGELDPDEGDDYISADDFLYSRCNVVANGRDFYNKVLSDPSQMPQDMEFESLLFLASAAFEELTGSTYEHSPKVNCESFQNAAGWAATSATRPGKYTAKSLPPGNRRPA